MRARERAIHQMRVAARMLRENGDVTMADILVETSTELESRSTNSDTTRLDLLEKHGAVGWMARGGQTGLKFEVRASAGQTVRQAIDTNWRQP